MISSKAVRRLDDLGRVVIPKELRKLLDVGGGDVLDIWYDYEEDVVKIRKHRVDELDD
ncbi:AbrB/MazE/SpoVT family DNA-binding domain-containing protein [Paenibacillus donghaensis]|uniref:AbrB/MazE/SpoVT family DNA-binding domain-containing protein n=1 Tax=Paenibacillus donghaensis TaxID=414771 RepID=UPI0012FD9504|nr:AbrB/MazE/SpoVT family DNA-binding domain-containing protein [Paenibacillus donghaensis]